MRLEGGAGPVTLAQVEWDTFLRPSPGSRSSSKEDSASRTAC